MGLEQGLVHFLCISYLKASSKLTSSLTCMRGWSTLGHLGELIVQQDLQDWPFHDLHATSVVIHCPWMSLALGPNLQIRKQTVCVITTRTHQYTFDTLPVIGPTHICFPSILPDCLSFRPDFQHSFSDRCRFSTLPVLPPWWSLCFLLELVANAALLPAWFPFQLP